MTAPFDRLRARSGFGWLGSPWVILLGVALFLIGSVGATIRETTEHPGILQLELSGTSDTALAVLRALADADMLGRVRVAIGADIAVIVGYVLALAALLSWFKRNPPHGEPDELLDYAGWAIVLAGILDLVEDGAMLWMSYESLDLPSKGLGIAAFVGTTASLGKWTLFWAVVFYSVWELRKYAGRFFRPGGQARREPALAPAPAAPAPEAAPKAEPAPLRVMQPEPAPELPVAEVTAAELPVADLPPAESPVEESPAAELSAEAESRAAEAAAAAAQQARARLEKAVESLSLKRATIDVDELLRKGRESSPDPTLYTPTPTPTNKS